MAPTLCSNRGSTSFLPSIDAFESPALAFRETPRIELYAAIVGLESAVELAEERRPWWHVANVPFQVVCTLLAMDSRESLIHIPQAMRPLRKISQQFHTASIRHAVDVAESLVRLSRQNKQNDLLDLNEGLDSHNGQDNILNQSIYGIEEMLDEDGEPDLDWDAFLSADIPLFDTTSLNPP